MILKAVFALVIASVGLAVLAGVAEGQAIYFYGDASCNTQIAKLPFGMNTCYGGTARGVMASVMGTCNADGTGSGTIFPSTDCSGTGQTTDNFPENACLGPVTLIENDTPALFWVAVTGC